MKYRSLFIFLFLVMLVACSFEKRISLEKELYSILSKITDKNDIKNNKELKAILKEMRPVTGTSIYNIGSFMGYNNILKKYFNPSEAIVLEIGPGANLLSGALFALSGVKKYYAVDIFKARGFNDSIPFNTLTLALEKLYPELLSIPQEKVFTINNGEVSLNSEKIEYIYPHKASSFPMEDNSIDFLFSNACFEHFGKPDKAVERIYSVLKKGGITVHQIDLRYHEDFSKPYELLKYSKEEWEGRFSKYKFNLHDFTNRWRAIDFINSFKKHGFKIIRFDEQLPSKKLILTEELKKTFHKDFQKYSFKELLPVGLFIVAKKE